MLAVLRDPQTKMYGRGQNLHQYPLWGGGEGGVSLKSHLVRTDLSARTPCQQEDCVLRAEGFSVAYVGETGASGYIGTLEDRAMGGWEVKEKIAFVFPKIVVI